MTGYARRRADHPLRFPCGIPESPWVWIGSPEPDLEPHERILVHECQRVLVWGGAEELFLGDEFDEMALVSLDRTFYIVRTLGCCCPTREQVWSVEVSGRLGPMSDGIWRRRRYKGFELPPYAVNAISEALDLARRMTWPESR